MKKNQFASMYAIYKLTLELSGKHESGFKKSLVYFTMAFVFQGLAFGMFYPLLLAMFANNPIMSNIMFYLGLMVFLVYCLFGQNGGGMILIIMEKLSM